MAHGTPTFILVGYRGPGGASETMDEDSGGGEP